MDDRQDARGHLLEATQAFNVAVRQEIQRCAALHRTRRSLASGPLLGAEEVMGMQRYLLVLDTDLPIRDEELDREPISQLAAGQGQEPNEVVVLSLVSSPSGSTMELLLGAGISIGTVVPVLSRAPRPDHHIGATAEHRMHRTVQHLKGIGCQASGIISDSDLLEAVRAETRAHDYDQVIVATSRHGGPWLARLLRRDTVHRLRRRCKQPLTVVPLGHAAQQWRLSPVLSWAEQRLAVAAAEHHSASLD